MRRAFLMILLLFIFSSCATSYSCKTKTAGKCQSVSDVYSKLDKDDGREEEQVKKEAPSLSSHQYQMKEPLEGKPILSEPKVLRVLLNYWEDEEKDLNLGGYVFVKVREAQWQMQ